MSSTNEFVKHVHAIWAMFIDFRTVSMVSGFPQHVSCVRGTR
uniref:Uncharacterized protein n=1 Tax=Ascaris lumbricoides TaxID=6252 RepID=A0A0M3HW77_ASCLU